MEKDLEEQRIIEIEKQVKELLNKTNELLRKVNELNEISKKYVDNAIKFNELNNIKSCHHIWFTSAFGHEIDEKNFYTHKTCVKCGQEKLINYDIKDQESFKSSNEIETSIANDPEYVSAVYNKIIEIYPDITDEKAAKFLEIAIQNNSLIDTTKKERKENIARRLKIKPDRINRYIGYGE